MAKQVTCDWCGKAFAPTKSWQAFCCLAHQQKALDLNAKRGKVATPFILAMRTGKRGRTEDSAYALQQLSALADRWLAEDKLAGRDSLAAVRRKRREGWQAADIKRGS